MIITRNHLPASGTITRDDLDALGDIQVALEDEDIQQIVDDLSETLGNGTAGVNYLRNAAVDLWTRGSSAVSLAQDARTERADSWWARADYAGIGSGGGGTYASYERAADAVHQEFLYCAKLTGTSGLNQLDFGQELPARIACAQFPKCTLTLEVENGTGAAITPVIRVDTCDSFENYATVTNQISQPVPSSVANAARATWHITLDLSGVGSALRNGALIYVRFTGLNGVGKFVKVYAAKLEIGENHTEIVVERKTDDPAGTTGGTGAAMERHYFTNPNLSEWLDDSLTCTEDVDNYGPRDWFARPSDGNTLAIDRSTSVPDTNSLYSAQLTGDAANTGTTDFGQFLTARTGAECAQPVVFSAWVYNATGATIQPTLRLDTCDAEHSIGAVTNRIDQLLQLCADSAWTQVSFALDGSLVTNLSNGARAYLRFDAGTLDSNAKSVRIAQPRLELGTTVATFVPDSDKDFPAALTGASRNFRASRTDATHIALSFDEIILKDAGGRALRVGAQSLTLDLAASGSGGIDTGTAAASTWYYMWVVARNEGAVSAVFSLSASAPTLPGGYIYRALVCTFRTDAGPSLPYFYALGKTVYLAESIGTVFSGTVGLVDVLQAVNLAAYVAPIAVEAIGLGGVSSAHNCHLQIGSTNTSDIIGNVTISAPDGGIGSAYNFRVSMPFRVPIITPQTIWLRSNSTTPTFRVAITGYTLP